MSQAVGDWLGRLGEVWIEGQVAQFVQRPGVQTLFLTLRDVDANISMQLTCHRSVLTQPLAEGARVIVRARPDFYAERGTLSLRATEIRQVGLGELLANIERLRVVLNAEGLFAANRKLKLPFLPNTIGLITGRASAAERDVVMNARRRLPSAQFSIENTATQGNTAVPEIIDALGRLDNRAEVEVIVIARGGGSVEDLLPFSNEALLRAVAACRTPVVSAIGHETDRPLLDLVADLAVSTPTDAARQIVPDLAEELRQLEEIHHRLRGVVHRRLDNEVELMAGLPQRLRRTVTNILNNGLAHHQGAITAMRSQLGLRLTLAESEIQQLQKTVISLSPQAVLDRGYAVIFDAQGALIKDPGQVQAGDRLQVRVAAGEIGVLVTERAAADTDAEVIAERHASGART